MKKHGKKIIAPIVVTIILIIYFFVYFAFLISLLDGFLKYILAIIPIAMAFVAIYVCIERLKEIRSGEEDDLSNY